MYTNTYCTIYSLIAAWSELRQEIRNTFHRCGRIDEVHRAAAGDGDVTATNQRIETL